MAISAEVIGGLLVAVLVVATGFALVAGILGTALGETFERCPRCGRLTLTTHGRGHLGQCPAAWRAQVSHAVVVVRHELHVRHPH